MLVPNRHGSSNSYRYGFQGQEKDDEIKGEGNSLNYTFRMHDPRVGRFFAQDPLFKDYPWNSPYAFSENKVIQFVELEGLEIAIPKIDKIKYGELCTQTGQVKAVGTFVANATISVVNGFTGLINYASELVVGDENDYYGGVRVVMDLKKAASNIHSYIATNTPKQVKKDFIKVASDVNTYEDIFGALLTTKGLGRLKSLTVPSKFGAFVHPELIRFTQKTMNGPKFDKLVQSMKTKGWQGEAIDVVKMKDNIYTSLDNKRLAAAQKAGVKAKVNLHEYNDPFPKDRAKFFKEQYGVEPKTYGEAAKLRINDQSGGFGKANPNGSFEQPKASGYRTTN